MRQRLTEFVQRLRSDGLRISVAETLDAMAAVRATGLETGVLREALAATLVKEESDRDRFDAAFDTFFSRPPAPGREAGRRGPGGSGAALAGSPAGRGGGAGGAAPRPSPPPQPEPRPGGRPGQRPTSPHAPEARRLGLPARAPRRAEQARQPEPEAERRGAADTAQRAAEPGGAREERPARRGGAGPRELLRKPFHAMEPAEIEAAREVARQLGRRFTARASRRERRKRRGRIDIRRTIRASLGRGGALISLARRGRRPGKPHLIALCDVSGSVSRASELLLEILAGADAAFSRVARFAYVDHLVPIDFVDGHLAPAGLLDLHARSDLGTVLRELESEPRVALDRSTVLLVLGDARNNRLPARADVLRRLAQRVRAVIFAVAEPTARWSTGDSALGSYAPTCDLVLETTSLGGLVRALREARRR